MKHIGLLLPPENYGKTARGEKSQTRRIIKPKPWEVIPPKAGEPPWPYSFRFKDGSTSYGDPVLMACPYGTVGDRLYVKEGLENVGGSIQQRVKSGSQHIFALRCSGNRSTAPAPGSATTGSGF